MMHLSMTAYHVTRAPEVFYIETMKSFSILTTILVWYAKVNTFNVIFIYSKLFRLAIFFAAVRNPGGEEEFHENPDKRQ